VLASLICLSRLHFSAHESKTTPIALSCFRPSGTWWLSTFRIRICRPGTETQLVGPGHCSDLRAHALGHIRCARRHYGPLNSGCNAAVGRGRHRGAVAVKASGWRKSSDGVSGILGVGLIPTAQPPALKYSQGGVLNSASADLLHAIGLDGKQRVGVAVPREGDGKWRVVAGAVCSFALRIGRLGDPQIEGDTLRKAVPAAPWSLQPSLGTCLSTTRPTEPCQSSTISGLYGLERAVAYGGSR